MAALQHTQRQQPRTVTGPGVGTVGVMAKPPRSRPADHLILERRRQEDVRDVARQTVLEDRELSLKHHWEASTTKRLHKTLATRRMDELSAQQQAELEERRRRLKAMLAEEERLLLAEAAASVETTLDKQARMRDRVKSLRENREAERQQFVEEKRRELFLRNCDPVREVQHKLHAQAIVAQRHEQIQMKQTQREQEATLNQLYDQLWLQDKAAKDLKATTDQATAKARTVAQCTILEQQRTALEEARERERQLRQEDETLRLEEMRLLREEEERERELKEREKRKMRADFIRLNAQAMKSKAEQAERELEEDIRLLKETLAAAEGVEQAAQAKHDRLHQEMSLYMQFVKETRAQQAEMDAAIEHFHRVEAQKAMERFQAKLDREQAARDALMREVMQTRKEQVAAKRRGVELERAEAARDYHQMMESVTEAERGEVERREQERQRRHQYAEGLASQSETQRRQRVEEEQRIEEDARRLRQQTLDYEEKVKAELSAMSLTGHRVA